MTITAVWATVTDFCHLSNTFTTTVSPTAIGDVVVVGAQSYNGVFPQTQGAPTGGGVTTWNEMATGSGGGIIINTYWGVVTSTGSSTLTITMSGSPNFMFVSYQQFHSSVSNNWAQDGVGGNNAGSASSGNYPSQSPVGSDELYVGNAWIGAGSGTIGGSTAGFVYTNFGNGAFNAAQFVYALGATTPNAYSPAWTQSPSDIYATLAGLLRIAPQNIVMII